MAAGIAFARVAAAVSAALALAAAFSTEARAAANWSMSGQSITNWRYQPDRTRSTPRTPGRCHPRG